VLASLVVLLVPLYYGVAASRINGQLVGLVVPRVRLTQTHPLLAVNAALRVGVGGIVQAMFFCVLLIVTGLGWSDFMGDGLQPVLIGYGVVLGFAELALGSFLCNVAMRLSMAAVPRRVPADREGWYAMSRGGWMRSFLAARQIAAAPIALAGAVLYVAIEECVFRGILIGALRPVGYGVALGVSVALFVAAQTFNMPGYPNALFPMIGATVIGITHGMLFLALPNIAPLIVAHVVVFAAGAL
jgi:hypothetical protein